MTILMDIVKFFKDQVDIWKDENKCGLCWDFSAPLVQSQINIVQTESEEQACCVKVFLTDIKFKENKKRDSKTTLVTGKTCVWNFTVWYLIESPLGVNNYNEIKGHDVSESKWNEIFYPIINCVGCDNILDTCGILGMSNVLVDMVGDAVLVHNYLDSNYNGWKVNYSFTQIT